MVARQKESAEGGKILTGRLRHATLGLLFLLSSGPAGLSNVLCIGADGHVSLEQAASPCCGDLSRASGPGRNAAPIVGPVPSQAREDCGDCVDIPLAAANTLATARHPGGAADLLHLQLGLKVLANAPAALSTGAVYPPVASLARDDLAPPSRRGALSHLRAVVLRC